MSIEMNSGGSFMKHRSKKPLRRGNQQYFNEKRPVNLGVAFSGSFAAALPARSNQRPIGYTVAKLSIFPSGNTVRQTRQSHVDGCAAIPANAWNRPGRPGLVFCRS